MQRLRVIASFAMTADGKFSPSAPPSDELQARCDAVLVAADRRSSHPLRPMVVSISGPVPLEETLRDLRNTHGVRTALCASDPLLLKALAGADLLDELFIAIAPKIAGGKETPTLTGGPGVFLPETRHFRLKHFCVENGAAQCHYLRKITRKISR